MNTFPAPIAANVGVSSYLQLREGNADPAVLGELVSQQHFQGAAHGGIGHCLTIPTDALSAATTMGGCALASIKYDDGAAIAELTAVVRTGRVYNVELVHRAKLASTADSPAFLVFTNFSGTRLQVDTEAGDNRDIFLGDRGLFWTGSAVLTIGLDPEAVVADLQDQIRDLEEEVQQLRDDFEVHGHIYLTGRGVGHNNTEATTDPPTQAAPVVVDLPGGTSEPASPQPAASADGAGSASRGGSGGSCGLGFEIAVLLPILAGLRRRSRHRDRPRPV
jgi:hypothetical protein